MHCCAFTRRVQAQCPHHSTQQGRLLCCCRTWRTQLALGTCMARKTGSGTPTCRLNSSSGLHSPSPGATLCWALLAQVGARESLRALCLGVQHAGSLLQASLHRATEILHFTAMLHTYGVEASRVRSHASRHAVPQSALFAALCRLRRWSGLLGIQGQQGCWGESFILPLSTLPGQHCCFVKL